MGSTLSFLTCADTTSSAESTIYYFSKKGRHWCPLGTHIDLTGPDQERRLGEVIFLRIGTECTSGLVQLLPETAIEHRPTASQAFEVNYILKSNDDVDEKNLVVGQTIVVKKTGERLYPLGCAIHLTDQNFRFVAAARIEELEIEAGQTTVVARIVTVYSEHASTMLSAVNQAMEEANKNHSA